MTKTKKVLTALLLTLLWMSCDVQKESISPEKNQSTMSEGNMVLGEKLENPYSVSNMQKAVNELYVGARIAEPIVISASHRYIKFKPRTYAELDLLKKDSTLELYTYPLDVEIVESGDLFSVC